MAATPARPGVLIANPGGITWMIHGAEAFARANELSAYVAPTAVSERDLQWLQSHLPKRLADPVISQLQRRSVPEVVGDSTLRVRTLTEVAYVLMLRTRLPTRIRFGMVGSRMRGFDRAVSRQLGPHVSAVIGYQAATTETFRVARRLGIPTVLDYPIAHYEVTERVLQEEARLVPEYAPTLQGHAYEPWRRERYREEIELADRIIMLSRYEQETFAEAGIDPSRTFIAPLCVYPDLFTPPEQVPEEPFRIAFCGQITQRKGISYLVEGFKRAAIPDSELLFIGPPFGTPKPWIDEPGVVHVPPMARQLLPEVLRQCHVFAMPSLIEGFGAAALEGMACGLPAIVSTNTFAYDVIEEGVDGWVIPIRDPDAIAERLLALHRDPDLRARMGAAARSKAEQFPPERYGEALRTGVAGLLAGRTR